MSYVKSLRFKLMLLSVIPLISLAFLFIAHSVVIAYQVKDSAADAYLAAVAETGDDVVRAVQDVSLDMGWIVRQWATVFGIAFVCLYIPITINIRKIILPIRQMAKYSDNLADGDVLIDVEKTRTDEIGVLQESFQKLVGTSKMQAELIQRMADGDISGNYAPRSPSDIVGQSLVQMLENNNRAMTQVSISAHHLAEATAQITAGSQALASGSSQQAASVEELSAAINEVSQKISDNAIMVGKAADLAVNIKTDAEKGNRQMDEMVSAVKDISTASHDIHKVIKVIDDIAFQTNILALNAAVEAARAGQHGKGFAVVADEVRNLAAKSAEAAKETGILIENSIEKAILGERIADETAESLAGIVSGINESSRIFGEIAKSANAQSDGIRQINSGIEQVSQVVQQNSATAEEAAASCMEMSTQFDILKELVSQFKLKDSIETTDHNL